MIRSGFLSVQDRKELLGCVKSQTEEHGIARRANALLLLDEGKPCTAIAKVLYIDDDTVRCWHKQYVQGGWEFVVTNDWQGGTSRMTSEQEATLIMWLEGRLSRSACEISSYIGSEFGLTYSHSGCVKLLARLGFEYRKPNAAPRVATPDSQAAFIAAYERLLNGLRPMRRFILQMPFIPNTKASLPSAGSGAARPLPSKPLRDGDGSISTGH